MPARPRFGKSPRSEPPRQQVREGAISTYSANEVHKEKKGKPSQTEHTSNRHCHCKASIDPWDNTSGRNGIARVRNSDLTLHSAASVSPSTAFFPVARTQYTTETQANIDERDGQRMAVQSPFITRSQLRIQPGQTPTAHYGHRREGQHSLACQSL